MTWAGFVRRFRGMAMQADRAEAALLIKDMDAGRDRDHATGGGKARSTPEHRTLCNARIGPQSFDPIQTQTAKESPRW